MRIIVTITGLAILLAFTAHPSQAITLIDHRYTDLSQIPDQYLTQAKSTLHIAYQHTSHGSQLMTGMDVLKNYSAYGTKYNWTDDGQAGTLDLDDYGIPGCEDLSQGDTIDGNGVTPWVTATRALLNNSANSHVNVIVWSWCSINGHNAQRYVENMEILISQYPAVKFVFMTGHAEGQGLDNSTDSVNYNNRLIRQHCRTHNRILFDFADIEAYNPDGQYFWDKDMYDNLDYTYNATSQNWATNWITAHPSHELSLLTGNCSGCAHSDTPSDANLNCVLKGRASWSLWARLAGWSGLDNSTDDSSCVDNDYDGYGDNCTLGPDSDDSDPFIHEEPTCSITVVPHFLGWFLGERTRSRFIVAVGSSDASFDDETGVRWETGAITTVKQWAITKRVMLMRISIDGASLDKGEYRCLVGGCLGSLSLVR